MMPGVVREEREGLWKQLSQLPRAFWMLNVMEMLERLAYYGVRVVIPIYIAQADEVHGLHFTQAQKGQIFMLWALVQTGVPIFSGGFADRYGYKKTIAFSIAIKIAGYLLMATQREFWPFTIGCLVLAFGTAIFKPGVWGSLQTTLTERTSGVGWGLFYMLVNVGAFLGPPLAHFLYGWSWPTVFFGCAVLVSLNFAMLFTYPDIPAGGNQKANFLETAMHTLSNLFNVRLLVFIAIMSGFWLMFMQLFDLLPNFIVDWVDSTAIVKSLHLPAMFVTQSPRGPMLAQEWMINLDSLLIVLFVVWISHLVSRMRRVTSIFLGIVISSAGLLAAGFTMSGTACLLGIALFAVGEMLASPKMNEYLGVIAPEGKKGLYMGYANMPTAIGWAYGSFMAGDLYGRMGEKAGLALRYLQEHGGVPAGVDRTNAMEALQRTTHLDPSAATTLLWNTYHPYQLWYPFVAVGLASAVGTWAYARWVKAAEGDI
ncbi:MAG: MFS transporter [Candidatus Eisenbacteria bacterium]|uniref:MFS transporter n=1 Tax=Eiseniibacteriota bacterium TaxID=2212470 RepID=A0A933WAR9_UNCEI|nr:MFS transporter [Candidatus Eisenbacteria bacterium]